MAMLFTQCPGAARLRQPTIEEKVCPVCGNLIEIFSTDVTAACDKCGFVAYNDAQNCIEWCKYAKQCIGEELYNKRMRGKHLEAENYQN